MIHDRLLPARTAGAHSTQSRDWAQAALTTEAACERLTAPERTWTISGELSQRAGASASPTEVQVAFATDSARERKEPLCSQA